MLFKIRHILLHLSHFLFTKRKKVATNFDLNVFCIEHESKLGFNPTPTHAGIALQKKMSRPRSADGLEWESFATVVTHREHGKSQGFHTNKSKLAEVDSLKS